MEKSIKISAAGNTEVPAYLCLKEKGFSVSVQKPRQDEEIWLASKGNMELSGSGPMELLALVTMVEMRGSDWKPSDEEIDEFVKEFC